MFFNDVGKHGLGVKNQIRVNAEYQLTVLVDLYRVVLPLDV